MAPCRSLMSTSQSVPSTDGSLIAILQRSRLLVRSATTRSILQTWSVPQDFVSRCAFIRWSWPQRTFSADEISGATHASRRVLLADDETIRVYDAADPLWQGTIDGASCNLVKLADIAFGHNPNDILVFSDFGVKLTIWSLSTCRGVEVRDPKYIVACYDYRPNTGHLALLTRAVAQDVLMLLKPGPHEVLKSVDLGTIDAQEVRWSADGHWIAVRDTASAGNRIQIYTANGHLFRTFTGAGHSEEIGLGIKCMQWSPAGTLWLGGYDGTITMLSKNTVSSFSKLAIHLGLTKAKFALAAQFGHTTPISLPDLPVWAEQINATKERSYIPVIQAASPPTSISFTKSTPLKGGISLLAFNNKGTRLATKSDAVPTTAWIWSAQSGRAIAVLIHHSPIKQLTWHPEKAELLLIRCAVPEPAVYIWQATWEVPRVITLPMETANSRLEASWLQGPNSDILNIHISSQTDSATAEITNTGELIPVVSDPELAGISTGPEPEDLFDEGNSLNLSPIKVDGRNVLGNSSSDSASGFDMTDEGINDTFHFRKQVKATR
ncbi:MAG: hypothetical protein Q9217_006257 [Psora testacea]